LERVFLHYTVDIQTEAKDLLWRFDAIERLAKAQVTGALKLATESATTALDELKVSNFMHPGPLWWAFDWQNASKQADIAKSAVPPHAPGYEQNGCVILIDEIDKAETDVPNGLLEALGARRFTPAASHTPVCAKPPYPLVVITTNEERALPDAFLRRCMVLNLALPRAREELHKLLVGRGGKHFPEITPEILERAAKLLIDDREDARRKARRPLPGQAEYLDLLRALDAMHPGQPAKQSKMLDNIAKFALRKHGPDPSDDNE
jgi:MoxR-like ATPase